MAPLSAYLEASEAAEISLARSAAPATISDSAEVLVFSIEGYRRAAKGTNGFTCLVERSWTDDFANPEFWNAKIRVPICLNAPASATVLPGYLERTKWVLGKSSLSEMRAAAEAHPVVDPAPGSLAFMMSRNGYLADGIGPAGPHLMMFLANIPPSVWGADLPGSPVGATAGDKQSITVFYLPTRKWSDGTPVAPAKPEGN